MKIAVVGTGYVGLVTAACLADFGHFVTGIDKDQTKIERLNQGEIPIYEIGLEEIVRRNRKENRLKFTTDLKQGIAEAQVVFIGVGTPPREDGSADLSQVEEVAKELARNLNSYKVIVTKSTVPVGTGRHLRRVIKDNLKRAVDFDVASNPEFLREGSAVEDFMRPDRVVLGTDSVEAEALLKEVYRTRYLIETPFILTNLETAELIKYASNAFLATKITFINELANLCEAVGGDIQTVAKGMGLDKRIGPKFLHAGPGYGGSCFPKDTKALARIARDYNEPVTIVETVVKANEAQKRRMVAKIDRAVGGLNRKRLVVLGIAFKPNTDDLREAPALTIIEGLLAAGAEVRAHDPEAMAEAKQIFQDKVTFCNDPYQAAEGADALVIITEWNSYRRLDLQRLKEVMRQAVLVDLRNIYTFEEAQTAGFDYVGVGKGLPLKPEETTPKTVRTNSRKLLRSS